MKTDEKLNYFYELLTEKARATGEKAIADQETVLKQNFEKYKSDKKKHRDALIRSDAASYQRQLNRTFASEQIEIRRALTEKTDEITSAVFADVSDRLEAFRKSPEYPDYLCKKINQAKSLVDEDAVFLLSPSDESYVKQIAAACQVQVRTDRHDFGGGFRVLCTKRNLLIDNSFETRLHEEKDSFVIE